MQKMADVLPYGHDIVLLSGNVRGSGGIAISQEGIMSGVEIRVIGPGAVYRSERGGIETRGERTLSRRQYVTARQVGDARERLGKQGGARPCAGVVAAGGAFVS